MDFATLFASSSSNDSFKTMSSAVAHKENSVVIINNNGASTGCFDASKNSKTNSINTNTPAVATEADGIVFLNNDDPITNNYNNNITSNYSAEYWDQLTDEEIMAGLDMTPELSPEMSIYSPATDSIGSPFVYDPLGFESSPSIDWCSPIESPLGANLGLDSFDGDFDVGYSPDAVWPPQQDFELFPVCAEESAKLKRLLMNEPEPLSTIQESSVETNFGAFSPAMSMISPVMPATVSPALTSFGSQEYVTPASFSEAKMLGKDMLAPDSRVAPRKVVQSPTKAGFQPPKKTRRRRVTSEEASRVIPADQMDDPNAKARYKCFECGKTFSRPFNLRSHRDTHTGRRPFECPHHDKNGKKCNWSFARRHDLDRHIVSKHTKVKNFRCRSCGVECTRADALRRHLARNEQCNVVEAGPTDEQDSDQCESCRSADEARSASSGDETRFQRSSPSPSQSPLPSRSPSPIRSQPKPKRKITKKQKTA
ncbi:hypothetical protein BGX29_006713 [Mortierella sp. GBA35]|nr:hypothetical protein BGX29_006713 [Mortierella sp. GBA35]